MKEFDETENEQEEENENEHFESENDYDFEEIDHDKYFFGMEEGYSLAKSDPEQLKARISELSPLSPYYQGFNAGKNRYDREIAEGRINELKQMRTRAKGQERTR